MPLFHTLDPLYGKTLYGVQTPTARSYLVAEIAQRATCPVLYITQNEGGSLAAQDELRFFLGAQRNQEVRTIPWVEGSVYNEVLPERYSIEQRMASLSALLYEANTPIIVASVESLLRRVIPMEVFDTLSLMVGVGSTLERDKMASALVRCGYQRVDTVEDQATFAVRGQVLDCFVPMYKLPVRVLFFDDEVEEMWFFDPHSQKRVTPCTEIIVHPARETLLSNSAPLRERLYSMADEANYPSTKTRYLLERITAGEEFFGMETLSPIYHEHLVSLFHYLPKTLLVVVENRDSLALQGQTLLASERNRFETLQREKRLLFPPSAFYLTPEELLEQLPANTIALSDAGYVEEGIELPMGDLSTLQFALKSARSEGDSPLAPLKDLLDNQLELEARVLIVVPEDPNVSPLVKLLREAHYQIDTTHKEFGDLPDTGGGLFGLRGFVRSGFSLPAHSTMLLSEEELFGKKVRHRKARPFVSDIDSLDTIEPGDYVVHKTHGIGQYGGIHLMKPAGIPGEYLLLTYLGGDKLYLPVHKVSHIARYRGGRTDTVKLDKLGGKSWERRKEKVAENVYGLAEQLLRLAAERAARVGLSYSTEDPMLLEFEAAFPFEETPDQKTAIDAVLRDMASDGPMDRLICGDVGYGKTEVALRAAFLAAISGRQVAMLAPTTLLVEQHYRTFRERFSAFPVEVASLSRFQSPKAQKNTLERLAAGTVDVLIGTHRILSRDLHFHNLGLLIVDEEQRFGVAQKEKLRFYKPNIDLLTLTATPIPRTLHMSIMGLRDISLITTPPQDRLAVKTIVSPTSAPIIREAIQRELARGGQVFVVVPRISSSKGATRTITEWHEYISDLVPEAAPTIAHGQMDPALLERIMVDFVSGAKRVLIATNIIESGLDISRANTILVMDANNFGLSQLYQLRGRVGRSRVRAYAYFFVERVDRITDHARKRLQALQRYSHLGAGFNLASEDLEIRGAGEMLGKKQSGAIAAVGFDTYVEIVQEALAELKGEPPPPKSDPEIKTDLNGYFPEAYIPEPAERLRYYRRLSAAPTLTDISDLTTLIADRYGPLPQEGELLVELMRIKALLRELSAEALSLSKRQIILYPGTHTPLVADQLLDLMTREPRFSFHGPKAIACHLDSTNEEITRLRSVQSHLHTLLNCASQFPSRSSLRERF